MATNYHEQQMLDKTVLLRLLIKELPDFCAEFFRGISETTTSNTRLVYGYDLRLFFSYLLANSETFQSHTMKTLTLSDLDQLTAEDIEKYLEYLTYYERENKKGRILLYRNKERGKSRKLACVRTLLRYFYKKRKIKNNPSELVDMPKIREKNIIRLEKHEVARLIEEVENGIHLTKNQQYFHEHTKERDLALIILLLGTGIRISECVGINLRHIDFVVGGIKITRKGGNEVVIYFGDEVRDALKKYLALREKILPEKGHEEALFLSLQNKRLTVRAIQNLVKKYAKLINGFKNISPHKLRSTFGTNLYRETRDIYLVADVLGHKDVNTTRKHYAQMDDERRKSAVNFVTLRQPTETEEQ